VKLLKLSMKSSTKASGDDRAISPAGGRQNSVFCEAVDPGLACGRIRLLNGRFGADR
jgi:hypothetical protein